MGLFDDQDYDILDFCSTTRIEARKMVATNKRRSLLVKREDNISKLLPDKINEGEQLYLISCDNFGSIELLSALVSKVKDISEVYITTWSYNEDFIHLMETILEKGAYVHFNCDKSIKTRKAAYWGQTAQLAYKYRSTFKVKVHDLLHAKVTLIKSSCGNYSIEASANYSKNTRIEQFSITNDKDRFDFNKSWISMI